MEHEPWRRRRLMRSSRERMWSGVAGGLAEYFDVDPTLMRLMWVVGTVVTAGLFVAVYFVMWVIMPLDSDQPGSWKQPPDESDVPRSSEPPREEAPSWEAAGGWGEHDHWYGPGYRYRGRRKRSAGIVLIVLGVLFLSAQAGVFRWINGGIAWALVLIVLGAAMLARHNDWRM